MREIYEVKRGFRFLFDVFPPSAWTFVIATGVVAGFLLYGPGAYQDPPPRWECEVEASPQPPEATGLVVQQKGCKCRRNLRVGSPGGFTFEWRKVSFEDWEWAREGDPWPLPAPESRPAR